MGESLLVDMIMMVWFLIFIVQQSGLYMSLILVPFSVALMLFLKSVLLSSMLVLLVFVMMFIGGLIVLLVSVASLSSQEQGVMLSPFWMVPIIMLFMGTNSLIVPMSDIIPLVFWIEDISAMSLILILLIVSLLTITSLVFKFKGLVRSACLTGVNTYPLFTGELKS